MDPLDKITVRTVELANYARHAFEAFHTDLAYEYLGELYQLLDDILASRARDKCESAKPPTG